MTQGDIKERARLLSEINKIPSRWFLTQNPLLYQGWRRHKDYFEGWYYKLVDPQKNLALAIIPGIAMDPDGKKEAFIQVLDGIACQSHYHYFDFEDFRVHPKKMLIQVSGNRFSDKGLVLDLDHLRMELTFGEWMRFPSRMTMPGIMGWYSFVPWMQCYHGLGSMDHDVDGIVEMKGIEYVVKGARGYVEKDWGSSFPKSWIWTQCNTFIDKKRMSVFASVAHIPWTTGAFIGFICALQIEGTLEVFATYNGSQKSAKLTTDGVELIFTRGNKILILRATKERGAVLHSPISGVMRGRVNESLQAEVYLRYQEENKEVLEARGKYAGLEIAGPVDILLDKKEPVT